MHTNLSAFVGEDVMIRYNPRDITEILIFIGLNIYVLRYLQQLMVIQ
ncbi:hypothetical protein DN407_31115 (plasmid) [Bacillus sp. JAS24-2]|nr:hypothetical protein DN407_31115 [Bacillus sp. JAS24-2]